MLRNFFFPSISMEEPKQELTQEPVTLKTFEDWIVVNPTKRKIPRGPGRIVKKPRKFTIPTNAETREIPSRAFLLDIQKPWVPKVPSVVPIKVAELPVTPSSIPKVEKQKEKDEIQKEVERKVNAQFLIDFPRTNVTMRDIRIIDEDQFRHTIADKVNSKLAKLAILLCTQGCFAMAFEEMTKKYSSQEYMVTDFPASSRIPHMCVALNFVEGDRQKLSCCLYKAFRRRSVDINIESDNLIIHTLVKFDFSYPIDKFQKGSMTVWTSNSHPENFPVVFFS